MKLHTLALFALAATMLQAQEPDKILTLGLKVGVPITDTFSASNTSAFGGDIPGSPYSTHTPRYLLGVSGEFKMPYHLRLEIDGLYKRAGFSTSSIVDSFGDFGYHQVEMNVWQVPALLKTNITLGHVRPFVEVGASMRHISSIRDTAFLPNVFQGVVVDNAAELHNRNSVGGTAGIGITFKRGAFELSPEVRYTRWANQAFAANGLRTNLDQGDVLLGISF